MRPNIRSRISQTLGTMENNPAITAALGVAIATMVELATRGRHQAEVDTRLKELFTPLENLGLKPGIDFPSPRSTS